MSRYNYYLSLDSLTLKEHTYDNIVNWIFKNNYSILPLARNNYFYFYQPLRA
jgi:hypothetical protein